MSEYIPKDSPDMLSRATGHDDSRQNSTNDLEDSKFSLVLGNMMERDMLSIGESRPDGDNAENVLESAGIRRRRLGRFDFQKSNTGDGGTKTPEDENTPEFLSSRSKDSANSNGSEMKPKALDKKGSKQVKAKICSGIETDPRSLPNTKVVGNKSPDSSFLEGLQDMESDLKVRESFDIFIRQTMGCEPYMSFTSRPGEKPLQRMIEHQQAMNKCVKSLKADIGILDGLEDNAHVEPHQADIERDPSGTKGGGSLGRGLQADRNLQTIKSSVPQAVAAFSAAKNPEKQNPRMDHLTDLPGWPLLSPSKVQLQKCEKCSREFFSPFNHRRHTRTHRRISHVDKEDHTLKRKNVAAFLDKLNQDEAQQIFASSRKYDLEDLSGEVVMSNLLAFKKQNNPMTLPPPYMKAGQDLLDMLDNNQIVYPLSSEQIFSILDEASEKTFLCSQGDVSKIGLEEKNLVASLGFIVEQTLVKAWMADKDAEALRNQQELVKEEEAAQMKRERNVAKKKKKKGKSRQKGLRERKGGAIQLAMNEENESIDSENLSHEIVEEDNSPTASSASVNSSGLENPLLEHLEMEVNSRALNADGRVQTVGGDGGHPTSRIVVPESVDEELAQQSEFDVASHGEEGERCSNFPSSSQVNVEDQGGCGRALEQDQNAGESRKRTPLRPCREQIRVDYQDSYQRGGWVPDPRFQLGAQQNSYRALRKPLIGTPYTSNIEFGSNPVPGFYRNKPASLRGTAPFPATQQWAKKAQTPAAASHVNRDGHEDESSLEPDTFSSKSNVKDSAIEHSVLAREMDADAIGTISGAEKVEVRTFEKKEPPPAVVPSIAKVVAGTGGSSNIPTASFNLNVNSEDWPPLSNSHAAFYPKSSGMCSTSYQCELNSRPPNKLNFVRGGGHQVGLESKIEGSIVTAIPPVRGSVDETITGSETAGFQKGIMIGSVSVPLGDHVHPSRSGLGSAGRRISTPLPVHQSYTAVLAAPPVRCTRDPMTSTAGRQKTHEGINHWEFGGSSNVQVMDSYGGPVYYRTSSIRSSPCMNLNVRHVRGVPTYPLGDRGILPKQPAWSCGPVRHLPQKVWRPVRPTGENADPNPGGGTSIETSPMSRIEKATAEPAGRGESIDAASSRAESTQVRDMDISRVEKCPAFTTDSRAQVGDRKCVMDVKSEKTYAPQDVKNCDEYSVSLCSKQLQNHQETNEVASVARIDSDNACHPLKSNATGLNTSFTFHDKNDNTDKLDDKAHAETVPSYSDWIAEALEFHTSRWQMGLKDPETVVGSCEQEYPELRTSKWIDFMDSLPSIAASLNFRKEDCRDPRTPDTSDEIGTKSSRNLPDEQRPTHAHCRQEGSAPGSQAVSSGEEPRDPSSACESVPPSGVVSTPVGPVSGSQNHGRSDNEGRIGSRCGSSCSDSSMTSNSRTERRDWTGTVNPTRERPQEKRYMPKPGRPEEKRSC